MFVMSQEPIPNMSATEVKDYFTVPTTGQIEVLKPFMARFGYIDGNGWWIKQET